MLLHLSVSLSESESSLKEQDILHKCHQALTTANLPQGKTTGHICIRKHILTYVCEQQGNIDHLNPDSVLTDLLGVVLSPW